MGGLSCLIECKDQDGNIAIDPVAKLRNQMLRRPVGVIGLVFSTAGFTDATKILARYGGNQAILLWNGLDIQYASVPPPDAGGTDEEILRLC
jgi:Restriction endonuclease